MAVRRTWVAEAGKYSTKVTVQRRDESQTTGMNEPAPEWKTYHTCWASLDPISGREFQAGDQTTADVGYRVRLRYSTKSSEITPKMRIQHKGRTFEIVRVVDAENRHVEMILDCREVV